MVGVLQYREDITKHLEFLGYSHRNMLDNREIGMVDAFSHLAKNTLYVEYYGFFIILAYRFQIDGLQIDDEKLMNINYMQKIKVAYYREANILNFAVFVTHYEKVNFGVMIDFLNGSVDSVMRKLNIG